MTDAPASPATWQGDQPRSRLYGDVYFSVEDGLAETRAVFFAGCGLPDAWAGRRRFTVAELGFGTGLNICALLHLWRRTRPPGGRLHIFSIEGHPLTAEEARRALAAFPELAEEAQVLTGAWPGRARGFHRCDLPGYDAVLDVAVMEAGEALAAWSGRADAWFLDGFAPAVNPQMWRGEVLDLIAARSAPGARAATYTVAGAVRRGLSAAGFEVAKRPGHGRKRERLEAWLPSAPAAEPAPARIAVLGAGIAGAALARAFAAQGAAAVVHDRAGAGAGASGNPAALVTPGLDAGLGPAAALQAACLARATRLYGAVPGAVIGRGVLRLAATERDAARFARIAPSDLFEPGALAMRSADEAADALGERATEALDMAAAQVIAPAAVLGAWAGAVIEADIARVEPAEAGWRLIGRNGEVVGEAEVVCLAAGWGLAALRPDLPLQPVRGQVSIAPVPAPAAATFGGYVAPAPGGLVFGATHDRDDADDALRPADHARNLALLAKGLPKLAASLDASVLEGRASIRATTRDRRALAGSLAPGLFVLGGLGSRGFTLAPLLAEHVAALALGAPSPLPRALADLVDPRRSASKDGAGHFGRRARTIDCAEGLVRSPMMKPLFVLAAVALLGACATPPASEVAAGAASTPRQCFFSSQINGYAAPDDRTVYLKVGVNDVYRLDLFSRCPDVDWGWQVGVQSRGSSICTGMDVDLLVPGAIGPQKCPVRKLTKLTPEEIAVLPPGSKP